MMDAIQLSGVSDPSLHKDEQLGLIKLHKHEILMKDLNSEPCDEFQDNLIVSFHHTTPHHTNQSLT